MGRRQAGKGAAAAAHQRGPRIKLAFPVLETLQAGHGNGGLHYQPRWARPRVSTGGAVNIFPAMGSSLAGPGIALLLAVLLFPGRRSWSEAAGVSIAYLPRTDRLALLSPFSLHAAVSGTWPLHPRSLG